MNIAALLTFNVNGSEPRWMVVGVKLFFCMFRWQKFLISKSTRATVIDNSAPRPSTFLAQRQPASKRKYTGLFLKTTANVSPRPALPSRRR